MADEVVVRLRGDSAALRAEIERLKQSMQSVQVQSGKMGEQMARSNVRTSKAIHEQNQSFTLMVAKLALVTFAIQTMANIIDSTFGALLRRIDDFQVSAIATAAAVTGITAEFDRPSADVFTQNLAAAKQTFEELEVVASRYFSTGQELQLAFNTLAQRGVVVRRDELDILAKVTDQIKLLTGGQNTQIQIQQELRALLDGTIKTTAAFGNALRDRGADIQQLTKEIRVLGSLRPLEEFLSGLDDAGPAIQQTLSSVTAAFQSLSNIVVRGVFQETYDDVVTRIREVNNFLIDQRNEVIAVGQVLVSRVRNGWNAVTEAASATFRVLMTGLTSTVGQLFLLIGLMSRVGFGAKLFLAFAAVVLKAGGSVQDLSRAFSLFMGTFEVGIKTIERAIQTFTSWDKTVAAVKNTFRALVNVLLLQKEANLEAQLAAMSASERQSEQGQALEKQLDRTRQQILLNVNAMEDSFKETAKAEQAAARAGETTGKAFLETFRSRMDDLEAMLGDSKTLLGVPKDLQESFKQSFEDILAEARKAADGMSAEFAKTKERFDADILAMRRELAKMRVEDEIRFQRIRQEAQLTTQEQIAQEQLLAAKREQLGGVAFERMNAIRDAGNQAELAALEQQLKVIEQRRDRELEILEIQRKIDVGDQQITDVEAVEQEARIRNQAAQRIAQLEREIAGIRSRGFQDALRSQKQIEEETLRVNRLLEDRGAVIGAFGTITQAERDRGIRLGARRARQQFADLTIEERARRIDVEGRRAREDFAVSPGATPEAIRQFDIQQASIDFFKAIETQVKAVTGAIDQVFDELVTGLQTGSMDFKQVASNISRDFIKAGLQDMIAQAKDFMTTGIETLFKDIAGFGQIAAQRAAQAVSLAIGLGLAVLARAGNQADFQATGGAGGSRLTSSREMRGIIGGDTAIPIAEINQGLQEALVPTNNILSQIERNTRALSNLNMNVDPGDINDLMQQILNNVFQQAILQNP